MNIYIVRHSKTIWNEQKRLQGHKDSKLTDQGIDNAKALKCFLQNNGIVFDRIYSSPILRAYETAKIIAGNQTIVLDERLKEMNFGDYEGCLIQDLLSMNPSYYDYMWNSPHLFDRLPNGESYEEVNERIDSFFNDIKKSNDESILIVTHGMYMILVFAYILKISKNNLTSINKKVAEGCSLNLIRYENNDFHIVYSDKKEFLPHISNIKFNK